MIQGVSPDGLETLKVWSSSFHGKAFGGYAHFSYEGLTNLAVF